MSEPRLALRAPQSAPASRHFGQPLGQILVEQGILTPPRLMTAMALQQQCGATLAQVLQAEGMVAESELRMAQSVQYGAMHLSLDTDPPDPTLADLIAPEICRRHALVPWGRLGDLLIIATARPDDFAAALPKTGLDTGRVLMAVAQEADIQQILDAWYQDIYLDQAEFAVPEPESCRAVAGSRRLATTGGVLAAATVLGLLFFPNLFFGALVLWACLSLFAGLALKLSSFVATLAEAGAAMSMPDTPPGPLPRISIMVPLFRERDIAGALVKRMTRLRYPRALTEIVFVLEADDTQTRAVLESTTLPPNFRVVEVPEGRIKTKPRALNYALGFCTGEIVGIYDAEDAPEPGQLSEVARRFAESAPDVACLQGRLDYYNPRANWLARCFTIEYATWFRVVLPGLARLGLVIPLGGTTLFFRRDILEQLGGWDAHNVTEDADLGVRLARHGYRTELIDGTTYEEANNRFWPWVRQRSRWLKGYMLTYLVHMRDPRLLLRELGAWRFFGLQIFFVTAISQFLLAPVLWSFWLVPLGLPHPLGLWLGREALLSLGLAFLCATAIDLCIGIAACTRTRHTGLRRWVATLPLYFPLGTLAAYKGLWEIVTRPFYWDKTSHGVSPPGPNAPLPAAVTSARSAPSQVSGE